MISSAIDYQWDTGLFRDISDIRRRVYTTHYTLSEQAQLLKSILGFAPDTFLRQLLSEIENPLFYIPAWGLPRSLLRLGSSFG